MGGGVGFFFRGGFPWGGGPLPHFCIVKIFSWSQIRLRPKIQFLRSSGSALKVPVWVGGGGVEQTNNHYHSSLHWVELSWFELS